MNEFPYVMLLQRRILGDETHCHAPRRMTWCSWHSARKPTLVGCEEGKLEAKLETKLIVSNFGYRHLYRP